MIRKIRISTLADIDSAAADFLSEIGGAKMVAFYAPLGAGKTTFISALCRQKGVEDAVNSPTFTILNEYRAADGERVLHFDFYRIRNQREALDIGLEEYFDSGCLCLMEWPENIEPLLPEETLGVRILVGEDQSRELVWEDGQ